MAALVDKSKIDLPDTKTPVSFSLVENGAAPVRFAARQYFTKTTYEDIVNQGKDKVGKKYPVGPALALRGTRLVCSGYVFGGGKKDTIDLQCVFSGNGISEQSGVITVKLTATHIYQEFYFFCDFV